MKKANRYHASALAAALVSFAAISPAADKGSEPPPLPENGGWLTDSVAKVTLANNSTNIFGSARNGQTPSSSDRFVFSPFFLPETGRDGRIAVSGPSQMPSGIWQVTISLIMDSDDLRELAWNAVLKAKPVYRDVLPQNNVSVWPVQWISLELPPETAKQFPGVELARSSWNIAGSSTLQVRLWCPSKAVADDLVSRIGEISFDTKFDVAAAKTVKSDVEISMARLKSSQFFAFVNGLDSNLLFVRRYDLQKLVDDTFGTLDIRRRLENPEAFSEKLLDKILSLSKAELHSFEIERKDFNKLKTAPIWQREDIMPTVIDNLFSRAYRYDENTSHFVLRDSIDSGAKVSLANFLGGEGHLKHDYSREEFLKLVATRDVTLALAGKLYVPKALHLLQLNRDSLMQTQEIKWQDYVIEPPAGYRTKGIFQLGPAATEAAAVLPKLHLIRSRRSCETAMQSAKAKATLVKVVEPDRLNSVGRREQATAERHLNSGLNNLPIAENYSTSDPLRACSVYETATHAFLEAIKSFDEVLQDGTKKTGFITGYSWRILVHKEDKEVQVHMAIRLSGAPDVNPGTGEHWNDDTDRSGDVGNMRIPLSGPVNLSVGIENERNERNCRVDAEFWITLRYEDESGRTWTSEHHIGNTQWSTDGRRLGASDIRPLGTVTRLQFAD